MSAKEGPPEGPRPDTPGFLVLLVLAAVVGFALIAGIRFLAHRFG